MRSPNRPAVLRLVTAFSVLGVTAGVATLVIALAMNTGFRETLQDRLLGVTAHVSLTRPGSGGIKDYDALAAKLEKIPGVRSVTPAVYQTVLITFGGQSRGVVAKGIDPAREESTDQALRKLSSGKLDFQPEADGIDQLLVGGRSHGGTHIDIVMNFDQARNWFRICHSVVPLVTAVVSGISEGS